MNTETNDTVIDPLTKCKTKSRALFYGAFSVVLMAIAVILNQNDFSLLNLPTAITNNGVAVSDSFSLFLIFGILSLIFAVIGVIYSLVNKKILGFLLSATVIGAVAFLSVKTNTDVMALIGQYKIEQRTSVTTDAVKNLIPSDVTKDTDISKEVSEKIDDTTAKAKVMITESTDVLKAKSENLLEETKEIIKTTSDTATEKTNEAISSITENIDN